MSGAPMVVEVKITLGNDVEAACRLLGLDTVQPIPYRLWFCEVVRLDGGIAQPMLSASDLILRLRSRSDVDDSTVKWRQKGELKLPADWGRRLGRTETKYEGDWSGDNQFESASLTLELPAGSVSDLVQRWPPLPGTVLSASQMRFAAAVAGRSRHLRAAQPLGPVLALKWRGVPKLRVATQSGKARGVERCMRSDGGSAPSTSSSSRSR